jgi:hypothetical protein
VSAMTTCPDWSRLLAHRFVEPARFGADPASVEPADWPAALAHLEDCASCRAEALGRDPSLLFELAPPPPIDDREVEAMRVAVRGMVRAHEVEVREAARRTATSPSWRRLARTRPGWWRVVAAAALLLAVLTVVPRNEPADDLVATSGAAVATAAPTGFVLTGTGGHEPLVEALDRPEATVYQLEADGLAVVMIVDASLDV